MTLRERFDHYAGFLDVGILRHGFAAHMRDYDVLFEALWGREKWADQKGTYLLRFTHCPEVVLTTAVSPATWKQSWSDDFIEYDRWLAAGEPKGFVWGVNWSTAYPGLSYVDASARAQEWADRLGQSMHEVRIETEAFRLGIVFHDFTVTKINDKVSVLDKVMFPMGKQDEGESKSK
jgi:hypothetical protein